MKNFPIAEPRSVEQVTSLVLEKKAQFYLLAGGTDLLDEIKNNLIQPEFVIDLTSIPNLSYIKEGNDGVRVGAMTTVAELAENSVVKLRYPGLREAALSLASPQLRNVATVGGNLCQRPRCWYFRDPLVQCRKRGGSRCFAFNGKNKYHAIFGGGPCYIVNPSDLAPPLISHGAEVTIASPKGKKTILLEDFYTLPRVNLQKENVLEPGELVTEVKIPLPRQNEKSTYFKLKERGAWDFALVSAAVSGLFTDGTCKEIRIVLGGAAPIPWRLKKAEAALKGKKLTEELLRQAVKEELMEARPLEENSYKRDLAEVAVYRAALAIS